MRTSTLRLERPPTRENDAILEHVQELGLQREMQVADLVEEHDPLVRRLELSHPQLVRAGEGTPLVPEELALQQLGGDGGAVDLDERPVPARRQMVDRARNQLLAGACLPSDEDRDVDAGGLLDDGPHVAHPGAAPEGQLLLEAYPGIVVAGAVASRRSRTSVHDLGDRGLKARRAPRGKHDLLGTQQVRLRRSARVVGLGQHDERPGIIVAETAPPKGLEVVVVLPTDVDDRHGERPARGGQRLRLLQGLGDHREECRGPPESCTDTVGVSGRAR